MAPAAPFRATALLKKDLMGAVERGLLDVAEGSAVEAVRRRPGASPLWSRPLAWILARREIAALRRLDGVSGVPSLLSADRVGVVRSFIEGRTLAEAAPREARFYADARRLLASIHRCGVTHNDTHKEANWLVTPHGAPALVDFQLASRHHGRGWWFRLCRVEDVRHLLKHKRTYCPEALTARERSLLATRSWVAASWAALVKPPYLFVTRRVFGWRDREGRGSG
jgi:RIO-like serine/threonine protein kinase